MNNKIISIFNKIRTNAFIIQSINTMILRVIGIITLFAFTLFLTHYYTPKIIGQYDFTRSFLLVVGSLCLLGTEQSVLYYAGILKGKGIIKGLRKVYKKKVILIFFTSLIPFLLLIIIGKKAINDYFNDDSIFYLIIKTSIILFFYCITVLNTEVFRALDKIYLAELYRNTFKYLSVIIGAVYLFYQHKEEYLVDTFLVGFIILSIISSFMIFYKFKKMKTEKEVNFNEISYKEIINKSFPMAISGMAAFLLLSFDIMFLKKYYGNEEVAFYSTAIKLITILSMIIISINITASTKIAEYYYCNNFIELKMALKKSSRLIVILTFPIAIFIIAFSETILAFFGKGYSLANNALIILMVGQLINSLFGSSAIYLNMTGRQKTFQYILILAVIINFISNRILIPDYGMIGAAISYVLSSLFWNITATIIVYYKDGIKIFIN